MADNEIDPSATSSDYDAMVEYWQMVQDILGGEPAIKAAGQKYLPKFRHESQATYEYRLETSPWTNVIADILRNLASKPFSKPIAMKDGTPQPILDLAENIDGQGNNLHVFAQQSFYAALGYGIDWILVDYTRATPRADGRPLSKAEEKEQGHRPYWAHIPALRMLAVYSDFVGGVEVIHHARILETSVQIDGFDETDIVRVRELTRLPEFDADGNITGYGPAEWKLWEQATDDNGKTVWTLVDGGSITIGIIPLVPVVLTKRQGGSWVVDPALRDLFYMQIKEYRQEANLNWVEVMSTFAMLVVSGVPMTDSAGKPTEITVGPNKTILIPPNTNGNGPAGDAKYIEPSGTAEEQLRKTLELTRKEMRDLGMQPMTATALTVITTANVSKKASSAVQAWVFLFQDALELAWKYTAMWLGDKSFEPEVIVHTDFAVEIQEGKELDTLNAARKNRDISRDAYIAELQRRDVLSADYDPEADAELIAKEQEGLEGEEEIDPRTGRPINRAAAA